MCENKIKGKDACYGLLLQFYSEVELKTFQEYPELYAEKGIEDKRGHKEFLSSFRTIKENFEYAKITIDELFSNCCGDVLKGAINKLTFFDITRGAERLTDKEFEEYKESVNKEIKFLEKLIDSYDSKVDSVDALIRKVFPTKEDFLNSYLKPSFSNEALAEKDENTQIYFEIGDKGKEKALSKIADRIYSPNL